MTYYILNRVKTGVTGTPGTGAVTIGSAVSNFQTPAQANSSLTTGDTFPYILEDWTIPGFEIGIATYNSAGTFTRAVTQSYNGSTYGTTAISLTSNTIVMSGPLAADLIQLTRLSIAAGKTFTASNTLTLTGTDGTSFAFPSSSGTVTALGNAVTGSGNIVLATSPTLVTPALGTPASGNLTNCTFPTLNQNTTGTAANVTGIVVVANGGTGATTLTGIVKGSGTSAFTAATAGTDYLAPPSGTAILKANSGGALANATAGSDYLAPPSGTAILKANSGGALANATAGTDYVAPATATTFTATQTLSGSSSTLASILANAAETTTVSATAATGTIAYDVTTQSVLYYTSNASANWTVNFRGSSGTSLNTLMSIGQSITVAFMVTQGSTAYYNNALQIDGTSVTPKWQGGTAPTAGNASGIDVYTYTITKTASATYTVLASLTQFK